MEEAETSARDEAQNALSRGLIRLALFLPYRLRVPFVGKIVSYIVAPYAGWSKRVGDHLSHAMPDLSERERRRIIRGVTDNVGRTLIEVYSGEEFIDRIRASELEGPGIADLEQARNEGRPIILVTAHLGNYDVVRGKLSREGYPIGALYRPMDNAAFNTHYVDAISAIATPVFPTTPRGLTRLLRHLKEGGVIGILADVASTRAPLLSFFGKPAHTPLSTAEWAIKYGAVFVPVFGIRKKDGLGFRIRIETPLLQADPEEMMQAYNDLVETTVLNHPEQWFWVHRRWKLSPEAQKAVNAGELPR